MGEELIERRIGIEHHQHSGQGVHLPTVLGQVRARRSGTLIDCRIRPRLELLERRSSVTILIRAAVGGILGIESDLFLVGIGQPVIVGVLIHAVR